MSEGTMHPISKSGYRHLATLFSVPLSAHVLGEIAGKVGLEAALGAGEDAPEMLPPLVPREGAVAAELLNSVLGQFLKFSNCESRSPKMTPYPFIYFIQVLSLN